MAGWATLNDWFTNEGFGAYTVADGTLEVGDEICIMYTQDYGEDLGGSWSNNDKTVKDITFDTGTLSPDFDKDTHTYTLTVSEGTEGVVVTPTATNKFFQVRTSIGTTEYKRSATVPVENGTVITVKCGDPEWPSMNGGAYGSADSVPAETYTITVEVEAADPFIVNYSATETGALSIEQRTVGGEFLDTEYIVTCEAGTETIYVYYPYDTPGYSTYVESFDGAYLIASDELAADLTLHNSMYSDGWYQIELSNFTHTLINGYDYSPGEEGYDYYAIRISSADTGLHVYYLIVRVEEASSAETPVFETDLGTSEVTYTVGDTADALTVEATVTDGGTVAYQWYSSADDLTYAPIDGAQTDTYTPPTETAGTTYYYTEATNTLGESTATTTSSTAVVTVEAADPFIVNYSATETGALSIEQRTVGGEFLDTEYIVTCEAGTETIYVYYPYDTPGYSTYVESFDGAYLIASDELVADETLHNSMYSDGWYQIELSNFTYTLINGYDYSPGEEGYDYYAIRISSADTGLHVYYLIVRVEAVADETGRLGDNRPASERRNAVRGFYSGRGIRDAVLCRYGGG